jgi:hypothetical protein
VRATIVAATDCDLYDLSEPMRLLGNAGGSAEDRQSGTAQPTADENPPTSDGDMLSGRVQT